MGNKVHPRDKAKKAGVSIQFLQKHYAVTDGRLQLVRKLARNQKLGLQAGSAVRGGARVIKVLGQGFSVGEIMWAVANRKFQLIERVDGDILNDHLSNLRVHPSEYGMKRCPKCKSVKDVSEFSVSKSEKNGLNSKCKSCASETQRKRAERNRRERGDFVAEEKRCGRCETVKSGGEFNRCNGSKDGLDSWCSACHAESLRNWRGTPAGKAKGSSNGHKRRARKLNSPGIHAADDVTAMQASVGKACVFCGSTERMTVEHMLSLSDRYDHGGSNWPHNLMSSCRRCNFSKNDKPLGRWMKQEGFTRQETLAVLDRWLSYALSLDVTEESQLQDFEPVIRGYVTSGLITVDDALSRLADVELARAELRASESV